MIDRLVNDYYQDPSIEKLTVVREVDMQTMHHDIGMDYFARNTKLSFAGFSMDEIRSINHIYDLIHPSDLDKVFQWTKKVIDFSNKHVESQYWFRVSIAFSSNRKTSKNLLHKQTIDCQQN